MGASKDSDRFPAASQAAAPPPRRIPAVAWSGLALLAGARQRAIDLGWRLSRRYRESEECFRALCDLLPALVLVAGREDGTITYANQASRNRLGSDIERLRLRELFVDDALRESLGAHIAGGCRNIDALMRTANDDRFWATLSTAPVDLGGRPRLLLVATDISEQRQLNELLSYRASHDALTEVYNRREFERRVERALARIAAGGAPGLLLLVDIDQFKLINDTSGYAAGDHLLMHVATLLRGQIRDGDVLARLGGDEFGVLATSVSDLDGARLLTERLRQAIAGEPFVWEQRRHAISASIGAVLLDDPRIGLRELLAEVDTACCVAKEAGRDRVHFYSAQDGAAARRRDEMEWVHRLRRAVDEGGLLLQYQEVWPLALDLDGGARVELLLRFRDGDGRVVPPSAFLPAAERFGLMPMVDRWVIETALANFERLHPSGAALQLATINLSGASVEDEALGERILELIERHGIEPSRVCFEITETVAVRNVVQVARFIGRLRGAGCRIALDDFGAGMSSFGYLKNLPVDIIKIDGSFVQDFLGDRMSGAIVRAVTDIGHECGLKVIAEWVDGHELADALAGIGVDYAQGFGLHRPQTVPFQRAPGALLVGAAG